LGPQKDKEDLGVNINIKLKYIIDHLRLPVPSFLIHQVSIENLNQQLDQSTASVMKPEISTTPHAKYDEINAGKGF